MKEKGSSFSGSIGFVLAAAGSAVGVGNIWRFPYLCAKDGGGLFLLVYLVLVLTFGFVLLTTDVALGRKTKKNALRAFESLDPKWKFLGHLSFLVPALIIYRVFADEMGAQNLWVPGTQLNDGIAYDYAQGRRLIRSTHNFENDILACAQNIAKRYMSSKSHVRAVLKVAETIFDSMRRVHGMGPRERLLLQIAVILHDCGKYISMSEVAKCSYEIIMSTEIIGLSHAEREMIANIVRFNNEPFKYYGEADSKSTIDRDTYMVIGKLTAILRVANALDRSHKQKAENIKVQLQDKELVLVIDTQENLLLEEGLLTQKADFFE